MYSNSSHLMKSYLEKEPDYSYLKPFGCLCFSSTLSRNRDKLSPRVLPRVFVGYPFGKKGYKILNLQNGHVFTSRNVKFIESIFSFSYATPMSKSFPTCFPTIDDSVLPPTSHMFSSEWSFQRIPISHSATHSSPMSSHLSMLHESFSDSIPTTELFPTIQEKQLWRSQRDHNPPKYLSDYICNAAFSVVSPNPPFLSFLSLFFFCYDTTKSI